MDSVAWPDLVMFPLLKLGGEMMSLTPYDLRGEEGSSLKASQQLLPKGEKDAGRESPAEVPSGSSTSAVIKVCSPDRHHQLPMVSC